MKLKIDLLISALLILIPITASAESVFLKNGNILEGKVVKGNDARVVLDLGGAKSSIKRSDIIRIVYSDSYKKLKYIYLNDNSLIKGYIVSENRTTYTVRKNLRVNNEIQVSKDKVSGIMNRPIPVAERSGTSAAANKKKIHNAFVNIAANSLYTFGSLATLKPTGFSLTGGYFLNVELHDKWLWFSFEAGLGVNYLITYLAASQKLINLNLLISPTIDFILKDNFGIYVGPAFYLRCDVFNDTNIGGGEFGDFQGDLGLDSYLGIDLGFIFQKVKNVGVKFGVAMLWRVGDSIIIAGDYYQSFSASITLDSMLLVNVRITF